MPVKWILIVDDEEGIVSVLKNSLKMLGDEYRVATASNAGSALAELEKRPFDLVVTDYKMAGMDGLELAKTIHVNWPGTRVILMTAYGNTNVEAEAIRLDVYRYLAKPLEIDAFRKIVKDAVGNGSPNPLGILFFSEDDYTEINLVLTQLSSEVGARCIFLTDGDGRCIASAGVVADIPLARVASLLGGSIATLIEAGRAFDNSDRMTNLAYHEGQSNDIYAINIGHQFLLIIVIDHGQYSTRLGTVWYSAQATIASLQKKFGQARPVESIGIHVDNLEEAIFSELQKIMTSNGEAAAGGIQTAPAAGPSAADMRMSPSEPTTTHHFETPQPPRLLSYEEAITAKIISEDPENGIGRSSQEERKKL